MKLFGKDYALFAEQKKKPKISSDEIGGTGTPIFSGIISGEEYLPELQHLSAMRVYDQMRKSDATVGAALLACKLPILGAKWFVQAADPNDPESVMQADFVEKALMELSETGWQDFIRQSLLMLDFGYMVFEKVFQIAEYEYTSDDLNVPKKEYIVWKKFAARLPKSIYRWEMSPDPASKKVRAGVTQILPQGGTPEIPMEKLLIFVNNKEGDNYNGISLLRTAYKHWYFKDAYYKMDAIGFEKQAVGLPTMKLPAGFDQADKDRAEELLQNMRANEKMYLVYPDTWTFEFADMKAHTLKDPTAAIEHHDHEIMKSVLAQFLNLSASKGGSGSKALSQDHSDLFIESLKATARHICDVVNKHAIKQLIDLNFETTKYPKLSFAKIGKIDWAEYATALQNLASAGFLTPDGTTEEFIREQLELPDKEDIKAVAYDTEGDDTQTDGKVETDKQPLKKADATVDTNEAPQKVPDSEKNRASELKKKDFSEGNEFVSWRPLTFAEKKVNFQQIQDRITEIEDKFKRDAKDLLHQSVEPLLTEFTQHLRDKNMDGVKNVSLPYKNNYAATVLRYLHMPYEYGKKSAAAEMKVPAPHTPQADANRMKIQADMIADLHESDIIKAMKISAIDSLKKLKASEFSVKKKPITKSQQTPLEDAAVAIPATDIFDTAVASISASLGDVIDNLVNDTAVLTTGMMYNQGRYASQDSNASNIYALQRSEILDERVCDFCISMDGLIVSMDDPAAQEDEYHSNCRGMWVEIMNNEAELPDITGVPDDVSQYYGGLNDIKKMPAPILRPDSPASRYVSTGDFKSK